MIHICHASGCNRRVKPAMFACRKHWYMVPKHTRDRIWSHYRPGQEDDKRPSLLYCQHARDAVISVARQEGLVPDTAMYDLYIATGRAT